MTKLNEIDNETSAKQALNSESARSENAPNYDVLKGDKMIAIGQQRVHVNAVTAKIREDIAFLEDRIRRMEKMKAPSETVLNTYRAMLASRKSVLKWLEEHDMIASRPPETKKTGS